MIDAPIPRPNALPWVTITLVTLLGCSSGEPDPVSHVPEDAVRLVEEGQALLESGKARAAQQKAEAALAVEKAYPEAHRLRGDALWQQSRLDPAVRAFQEGLPYADSGDGTLEKRLGELAASVKYHDIALSALEAARRRGVEDPRVLQLLAEEYTNASRREDALECYRELHEREPKNPEWQLEIGRLHLDVGRLNEARVAFQRASAAEPVSPKPWAELGGLAVQEGDLQEAERHYLRSLDLDPDQGRVLSQLAMICSRRGDSDRAEEYQERYQALFRQQQAISDVQRRQNHLQNMTRLARRALNAGDDAGARAFLERYVALDPDSEEMRRLLIGVYERLGLEEEAARLSER